MGKRSLAKGAVGVLAITAVIGCGDQFTLLDPTPSGSGSSGSGGASGATSGTSSSSGGGAVACTPGNTSPCKASEYCPDDMKVCTSCSEDIARRFKFGTPQQIALAPPTGGSSLRFPRIGLNDALLFTFTSSVPSTDIGHAEPGDGPLQWKNSAAEPDPINSGQREDNASLYVPAGHGDALNVLVTDVNVQTAIGIVFYHYTTGTGAQKIFAFNPGKASVATVTIQGASNSHIAVAYNVPRLWYTSNAISATDNLVTATPGNLPAAAPMNDSNGCKLQGNLSAWVTPDGKWLLFSKELHDNQDCTKTLDNGDPHLFYTAVDPTTGQQVGQTFEIPVADIDDKGHSTPSLSPDLCTLFFTEQINATSSELRAASRQ